MTHIRTNMGHSVFDWKTLENNPLYFREKFLREAKEACRGMRLGFWEDFLVLRHFLFRSRMSIPQEAKNVSGTKKTPKASAPLGLMLRLYLNQHGEDHRAAAGLPAKALRCNDG